MLGHIVCNMGYEMPRLTTKYYSKRYVNYMNTVAGNWNLVHKEIMIMSTNLLQFTINAPSHPCEASDKTISSIRPSGVPTK